MTRKLRGALVGFGFIAENGHRPAYLARAERHGDIELAAIVDTCAARRDRARQHFPDLPIYPDTRTMLSDPNLSLDFVDLAVPPCDHERLAHLALDHGLHVLCEKPLATTPRAARAMIQHALQAKRVLFPCHNYRHAPVVKAVGAALDSGAVGSVRLVTMQTFRPTHARGVADWRPDWRRDRSISGGGIAMDHGSHTFYLALDWLHSLPTSVSATMTTTNGHDTEDSFSCTANFPTGMASTLLTWSAGVRKVIYTIHGDAGGIRVEDDDVEITTRDLSVPGGWRVSRSSVASKWMDASHSEWFVSLFGEFVSAVLRGDLVGRDARNALECVDIISTAYASAHLGGRELRLRPSDDLRLEALTTTSQLAVG